MAAKDCQPFTAEELIDWPFNARYYQSLVLAYGDPDIVYTGDGDNGVSGVKHFRGTGWRSDIDSETHCLLMEIEIEREGDTTETILLYRNVDGVVIKIPLEFFYVWDPN